MTASSTPDPVMPSPGPKRPWTILGRLSKAVREQNWFAVALELLIVVLGVVIGFQVTAWGEARSDAAREHTYLHQLAGDLRETEQRIANLDSLLLPYDRASSALMQAFFTPSRPSQDSLITWLYGASVYVNARPVTATAEALVATGDLALIRNDSLRSAITAYLGGTVDLMDESRPYLWNMLEEVFQPLRLGQDVSMIWDLYLEQYPLPATDPLYPLPLGSRRQPVPPDVDTFLSNPAMQAAAFDLVRTRLNARSFRHILLDATVALREQVEAELEQ